MLNRSLSQTRPLGRSPIAVVTRRRLSTPHRALSFDSIPPEALVAGGTMLAGFLALVGAGFIGQQMSQSQEERGAAPAEVVSSRAAAPPPLPPREDAVLVLGATGRVGRRVVQKLLSSGRTVIAAARTPERAQEVLGASGLKEGLQQDNAGILFLEAGVDVTRSETLDRTDLWKGVSQVVSLLGPRFGPQPDGSMGYYDDMTPERVEAGGWDTLSAVLPKQLPKATRTSREIVPMRTPEDIAAWERLDDVIMGGQSSSSIEVAVQSERGFNGAVWKGDLIVEGGGFCGTRSRRLDLDLGDCDGIQMRVRGDGQTFKINIKTVDQLESPESTYQATFDTVPGQWSDVYIPWHNFVPVKMAQSVQGVQSLDPSKIAKFGLVLSRFEFNKMPNPSYKPGPWQLEIEGGLKAYRDPRPQIVLLSSAGVERNAIIGDDVERRKKDIPIVQLNPGGTLNFKYMAEAAVRSSGYPYSVIRSTGMIDSVEGGPFLLEADQGDSISGYMGRDEAADLIVASLTMPEACGKTFEVRRNEARDAQGKGPMSRPQYLRMFLKLGLDSRRWRNGLLPFPRVVPPPPPPTPERVGEILEDVKKVRETAPVAVVAMGKQ